MNVPQWSPGSILTRGLRAEGMSEEGAWSSHIIHIARVGHLLQVEASAGVGATEHAYSRTLQKVLQVHEAAPHVAKVHQRICGRAGVPKPLREGMRL